MGMAEPCLCRNRSCRHWRDTAGAADNAFFIGIGLGSEKRLATA